MYKFICAYIAYNKRENFFIYIYFICIDWYIHIEKYNMHSTYIYSFIYVAILKLIYNVYMHAVNIFIEFVLHIL
jgi:hypothetical protein